MKEDLLTHAETQAASSSSSSSDSSEEETTAAASSSGKVLATPAVRRVAREMGVSLSDVRGTGEGGRVLKEDVLRHVEPMKGNAHYCDVID